MSTIKDMVTVRNLEIAGLSVEVERICRPSSGNHAQNRVAE